MNTTVPLGRLRRASAAAAVAAAICFSADPGRAQAPGGAPPDSSGTVRVRAVYAPEPGDTVAVEGALVRAAAAVRQTGADGVASFALPPGEHAITVDRLGFRPITLTVLVRPRLDTTVVVFLSGQPAEVDGVVVTATRSGRRIEDEPLRVEVLSAEEVEEKLLMTPGDITMMLNETSGLRVQTTSPSLGGATVRVQGLRGRYTQILADGLPLYGGQTGGLGLLQIPPMDLGGVEVIKGVASALYGGSALGGVINLLSRRPVELPVRELLANQTTLGGTDAVAFDARRLSGAWGYTLLAGAHRQSRVDRDDDGWTDLPGYRRGVVRPRLYWSSARGSNAMVTAGGTIESREGGTAAGRTAPSGLPYLERLRTARFDAGVVGRFLVGAAGVVSVRGSAAAQDHRHVFGPGVERDRHVTWFGEAAYTATRGAHTWGVGAALQQERYDSRDVPGFDYVFTTRGLFAQSTVAAARWLAVTTSGRLDRHSEYGAFFSPRVSALVHVGPRWTVRASAGTGFFAPTPFTEETEVIGLRPLAPLDKLDAERARSASVDVGGALGPVELNATVFESVIEQPVGLRAARDATGMVELVNAPGPTRSAGTELLARWTPAPLHVTATYTFVRSTEVDPASGVRRRAPLVPRHQAGVVTMWEREGSARVGVEVYYTGRQALDENPYRTESRPYVHVGVLAERRFGPARVFVNAENLLDVRQSAWHPLVRPTPGLGGRWTTDVWAPLEGRVANIGVRVDLQRRE